MRKKLTFLFLLLAFTQLSAQEVSLKEMVAIVRPNYYEGAVKFLKDYSKALAKNGYSEAAEVLRAYTEGGFGSGFVYKSSKTGKFYVITNKHVLANAKDVSVEIYDAEDVLTKIRRCPIVAVDPLLDLGIIELPSTANLNGALTLSSLKIKDADEVFTAGFPGLGKDPSWQIGKGIVSNASLQKDELTNGTSTHIIQHTAQIDAGSSGGPLLVRNDSMVGKFEVVGINTWKARGRENANFAIPSKAIARFITEHVENQKPLTESELKLRVDDFIVAGQQSYVQMLPLVSYRYFDHITVENFYNLVNYASDKAKEAMKDNFTDGHPIEGVRIIIADALVKTLENKVVKYSSIENYSGQNQPVNVIMEQKGVPVASTWYGERGLWQIADFSLLQINRLHKKGIATDFGYSIALKLGADVPLQKHEGFRYRFSLSKTSYTFLVYDFEFELGSSAFKEQDNTDGAKKTDDIIVRKNDVGFNFAMGAQLPINVGYIYLVPRLQGFTGIELRSDFGYGNIHYGYYAGLETVYKLKRQQYLFVGLGYRHKFIPAIFLAKSKLNSQSLGLQIHVGISF